MKAINLKKTINKAKSLAAAALAFGLFAFASCSKKIVKDDYGIYSDFDTALKAAQKSGKKILLIRDSYACVVAPFLALQTSELHICDMRDYKMHVGNKLNAEEYIKEIKPDYVIVLYSGISAAEDSSNKFNFF